MLFTRAAAVAVERRSTGGEWGSSDPPSNGSLGAGSATGVAVSERTALQVAAVYGSVGVIADAVSTLPLQLWSSADPKTKRLLAPGPLLERPYAEISRIDWLTQYTLSMALRGNFYGHIIERDRDLYPTQIRPIHPDYAQVRRIYPGQMEGWYPEYRFYGKLIPIDDVFHVRYLSVAGSLVGLNPIEYLRNTIGLARAVDLYGGTYFSNPVPRSVIEVEEDLEDPEALALARRFQEAHSGVNNAHMPAVMTGGATYRAISLSPEDSQFLQTRQFSQGEISGMIFRVPPHMIGIVDKTTSWGTGIAQQEQGFVTNTLMGYLGRLEEAITELGPRDGRQTRFNVDRRMRGDKLQRYQAYGLGIASGFLCGDDARAEEDMGPIPGGLGQTFLVPINSQTLKQAVQDTIAPATTPPAPAAEQ